MLGNTRRVGRAVAADADLTIDQLAQRTGMTVRNLRAHQSRGLLPPPEVRARTGFYGVEHVARIELIKELQAGSAAPAGRTPPRGPHRRRRRSCRSERAHEPHVVARAVPRTLQAAGLDLALAERREEVAVVMVRKLGGAAAGRQRPGASARE